MLAPDGRGLEAALSARRRRRPPPPRQPVRLPAPGGAIRRPGRGGSTSATRVPRRGGAWSAGCAGALATSAAIWSAASSRRRPFGRSTASAWSPTTSAIWPPTAAGARLSRRAARRRASRTAAAVFRRVPSDSYFPRGQKKPRRPSLRTRGTTWTWKWGTLWRDDVVGGDERALRAHRIADRRREQAGVGEQGGQQIVGEIPDRLVVLSGDQQRVTRETGDGCRGTRARPRPRRRPPPRSLRRRSRRRRSRQATTVRASGSMPSSSSPCSPM